jgi:hypothetical protein
MLHRGRWFPLIGVVWCFTSLVSGAASAEVRSEVWAAGHAGAVHPSKYIDFICHFGDSAVAGVVSSAANPFSIHDLLTGSQRCGLRLARVSVWVGWGSVYHPQYREHHLSVGGGIRLVGGRVLIGVAPELQIRRASGYAAERAQGLRAVSAVRFGSVLEVGASLYATGADYDAEPAWTLASALAIERFEFLVNVNPRGGAAGDLRVGVAVEIVTGMRVMSGYRAATDEIAGGLSAAFRRCIVGVACSHHPLLGRTVSATIGKGWVR